ncbi:phosphoribosylamine--glycine ligase [Bradyrhizobium sp. MOS003]|uniref:phosphoribosylamine--glycine ligase n=1 Tax=Bradyrhizobium sp. MOS003 TaxID=2133946 RepID=UPI000D1235A8|nr:phosphoribosylamine--glycine ligase [Bradyrhizobium sp. MOS003]PSO14025.1 phosphoribosylamine--glycine ligase [Bradyrhizobium sp. MOS003]
MRFLGIGDSCDLGALYMRLVADGHEVRTYVGEPLAQGTMAGLVDRVTDWEAELDWIGAAGEDGIILFENVAKSRGQLQDRLRKDGFNVIGGSAYGDRLENDRAFGQRILADIGLQTARVEEFTSLVDAEHFLARYPGRYVLKFNGTNFGSRDNYVGRLSSGQDSLAVLQSKASQFGEGDSFILMEYVEGVEMGVGAYFDGQSFVGRACLDWEHKRFFPGNLGELTGEMGTIATFDRSEVFFERTLKPMAPLLSAGGYCGYINLNTIVNRSGIWPLEFTCRFGYPGFAVLGPLQETHWADLFAAMTGRPGRVQMRPGFCAAVVLTTPPFPYDRKAVDEPVGLPVIFDGGLTPDELEGLYYGEVGVSNGRLVTSGQYGWTMVATGTGTTIGVAREGAVALADKVVVPNLRYRRDIGCTLIDGDFARVDGLGLLG